MSYGRTCLFGVHVSRITCLMGAYVLREVKLCRRKCHMGGHVLVECISSGWYILQDDVFYLKTCLT